MTMYNCYIIDDEPLALRVIEQHLSRFSEFKVCGTSTDPVEALGRVKALPPDLLFLDISMPDITGLEFIEALQHKPEIILTTAHRDYAVDGFNLQVLDYLVKPIPFTRFAQSINKFLEKKAHPPATFIPESKAYLNVKADRKNVRIDTAEILYIEGVKDYAKIVTSQQNIVTKMSIGQFMSHLPADRFIQVHKSFIVAKQKITAYTAQDVEIGGKEIPIGRMFKDAFLDSISK